MGRKRINYETEMQILGIYYSGITIMNQICEKSKCSEDSVRRVLKKHGLSVSRSYKRARITPEIINRVRELYDSGMHFRDIAVNLSIGSTTARNIVNEYKDKYKNTPEKAEEQICDTNTEQQMQLPLCSDAKDKEFEALCMIRDALTMLIEARMA